MTMHPRTFLCKPGLWTAFEDAARSAHVGVDELVNEALLHYARTRGFPVPEQDLAITQDAEDDVGESEPPGPGRISASPPTQRPPLGITPEAVPRAPPSVRRISSNPGLPPPPPRRSLPPPAPPSMRGLSGPASSRKTAPPPLPSTPVAVRAPAQKLLSLFYLGTRHDVDKDRFLIGRSQSQADLRVEDPNVSRQHAAIERVGQVYYLVDLGSTNGVYVGDDRVTRRALADGDVIVITTHEISVTLR